MPMTRPPLPPFSPQDFNLVAEASGPSGLYTWTVSLAGFSPSSPLAQASRRAARAAAACLGALVLLQAL